MKITEQGRDIKVLPVPIYSLRLNVTVLLSMVLLQNAVISEKDHAPQH